MKFYVQKALFPHSLYTYASSYRQFTILSCICIDLSWLIFIFFIMNVIIKKSKYDKILTCVAVSHIKSWRFIKGKYTQHWHHSQDKPNMYWIFDINICYSWLPDLVYQKINHPKNITHQSKIVIIFKGYRKNMNFWLEIYGKIKWK